MPAKKKIVYLIGIPSVVDGAQRPITFHLDYHLDKEAKVKVYQSEDDAWEEINSRCEIYESCDYPEAYRKFWEAAQVIKCELV